FTAGLEFPDPIEPARRAIARARSLGANAVLLAGHMGLKERTGGDDFANRVIALTGEFPGVAAFIAGHTHQDIPSRLTNGVIFTQADHFGIHVGRLDLVFDRGSKKLLHQNALCELMDNHIALDATILSRTRSQLDRAAALLAQPVGELTENLRVKSTAGNPSNVELLIAAAITEALAEHGTTIDGVFHGLFEDKHVFKHGPKTIADIWEILPYENYLVTGELLPNELEIVLNEMFESRDPRSLAGFSVRVEGQGSDRRLTSLRRADGRPVDPAKRYRIAFNTFDASSAGHRFMKLRELLNRPEAHRAFHPVQTRDAVIDYFRHHKIVHPISNGQF
ncbi:MAG: 5'-nucleotidase C-terminal domain-containing protein, partial [Rhodanobacteraceae bacterium]